MRSKFRFGLALAFSAVGLAVASAQENSPQDALPAGPKQLLMETLPAVDVLREMMNATKSPEEWLADLDEPSTSMSPAERQLLAEYLSLNMPVGENLVEVEAAALVASFPADGKELFVANCLGCHGAKDYYLLQDREQDAWLSIFEAPFHQRLLTGAQERDTFSSYAAIMMPMDEADIPAVWQD